MPTIESKPLIQFATQLFSSHGVPDEVAAVVADSLVLSNLKGHDSHGVIRVINYVDWLAKGWFAPDAKIEIVKDEGVILMVDGHFQFGQVVGRQSTRLAIEKTRQHAVCLLTIRRSGHLGRIGEFAEMAAEAGFVTLALTNTHGSGILVAPHGGYERRLSANPIGGGAPAVGGNDQILMDLSTCTIAEGKIKVARSKRESVPPGCIVNSRGQPTTDPEEFYADPPGALLPMAGHKGFALSIMAEVFAGALSGAGCSRRGVDRVANGWFALFVDPNAFCGSTFFDQQIDNLTDWVKSSKLMPGVEQILMPGEPEARVYQKRRVEGVPIDEGTWEKITAIGKNVGVTPPAPVS